MVDDHRSTGDGERLPDRGIVEDRFDVGRPDVYSDEVAHRSLRCGRLAPTGRREYPVVASLFYPVVAAVSGRKVVEATDRPVRTDLASGPPHFRDHFAGIIKVTSIYLLGHQIVIVRF
jgi:hypothetical protein